ncbi:hypothetical protein H8S95_03950 [Pontibacter sp. KCTC 32443]|uniref:hypothetical protein n=1 Tax=Pontibacter TaxID=323449 RepID=UPI00164D7358|nr:MULTISPECIES: hypothetical protein [Pontibacter]MBC5773206.1 hypothetical protein [Pontibacter sp. KCTC 32443]
MKNIVKISLLLMGLFLSQLSFAQKMEEGLPEDLPQSKIMFLAYEMLDPARAQLRKPLMRYYEKCNEQAVKANEKLKAAASEYPYEHIIITRAELIEKTYPKGYKYVMNCDLMDAQNNGEIVYAPNTKFYSPLYILNIETGERYELMMLAQAGVYSFEKIMNTLNKKIKKQFN